MRIGLIGAGAIARRHVGVLSALDGVELAAVCDSDLARAESVAAGAAVYGSWQQLLEHPLDAVFVCTPPAVHAQPAIAALRQGLAVYLEKPLARTANDGEAIVAAWRESGGVCAVGYQWRSLALLGRVRDGLAGASPGMLISRSVGADRARPCGVPGRRPGRERRDPVRAGQATTSTCSRRWPGRPGRCRPIRARVGRGRRRAGRRGGGAGAVRGRRAGRDLGRVDGAAGAADLRAGRAGAGGGAAPGARPGVPAGGPCP